MIDFSAYQWVFIAAFAIIGFCVIMGIIRVVMRKRLIHTHSAPPIIPIIPPASPVHSTYHHHNHVSYSHPGQSYDQIVFSQFAHTANSPYSPSPYYAGPYQHTPNQPSSFYSETQVSNSMPVPVTGIDLNTTTANDTTAVDMRDGEPPSYESVIAKTEDISTNTATDTRNNQ
jgi:hypothetical protein